tara:strand:+ start:1019 stop:1432 length:414 start_codon:yes stop_codon:yes gene_type:complete
MRRKPKVYKNQYKVKVIEHKIVTVEADSEQDVIDYFTPSNGLYPRIRTRVRNSTGDIIGDKLIKKSAKVISEELTQGEADKRAKAKETRLRGQIVCEVCDQPRTAHQYYGEYWSRPCPDWDGDYRPKYTLDEWLAKK